MRLIDADELFKAIDNQVFYDGEDKDVVYALVKEIPTAEYRGGRFGWVCPICGRGLSPYTNVCPCQNGKGWEVTCG